MSISAMRLTCLLLSSVIPVRGLASPTLEAQTLVRRSTEPYAPQIGSCPATAPKIRNASTLSTEETEFLVTRRKSAASSLSDIVGNFNITGFDAEAYISKYEGNSSILPNIGIAISGGGYRAMLNGAGVLAGLDSRTGGNNTLGGLLQSATYLTALSGGGWLVGSLYINNFTSVADILAQDTASSASGNLWQLGNSIFEGPATGSIQLLDSVGYYAELIAEVHGKASAGFNTSITDYWGRALSYQLVNASEGGPGYTFSSIVNDTWFNENVPLPILVSDERFPGQTIVSSNSTVFEISPFEIGSQDPTVYGFAPLQYVGTSFFEGAPMTDSCVTGFDNIGFVMGTSSSLFNAIVTADNTSETDTTSTFSPALIEALEALIDGVGNSNEDIASWVNPFYGWNNATNPNAVTPKLSLTDGGEDDQNIPLHPLIQPNRAVDVVFAVDSSADTTNTFPAVNSSENWPAGISLIATYERSLTAISNGTAFPSIPDTNTFFNLGLNIRPTFFGCNASNITAGPAPLIVYLPNGPYSYLSNTSTFDMEYNDTTRNAMIQNGYNLATQGNGTVDSQWPACVGCAIFSRSLDRTNTALPDICETCFDRYCWNGTLNQTTPERFVPEMRLTASKKSAGVSIRDGSVWFMTAAAAMVSASMVL